jgi:hypothetical protein
MFNERRKGARAKRRKERRKGVKGIAVNLSFGNE